MPWGRVCRPGHGAGAAFRAPRLRVHVKALRSKLSEMTDLLAEIFNDTVFTNKKRLRELFEQAQLGFELSLQNMAPSIVSAQLG